MMTAFLFVFADKPNEWNVSQWRSLTPSDGINLHGNGEHKAHCMPVESFAQYGDPAVQEVVGMHDVVIVQRNMIDRSVWEACDYWRLLGKTVVGDLDDDYPRLTPQNPAHTFWIGQGARAFKEETGLTPIESLTEGLRHVDALVSPNQLILDDWERDAGVPGYVLFNYACGEWFESIEQKPPPAPGEPVVLGWGGSVSHYDSWWFSGLLEAAGDLFDRYPELIFKICGNDVRLKRLLKERWPRERWVDQAGVMPQEWPAIVASFDVGLAPLCGPGAPQSEYYDQHRSWIKAAEYILCGVPWVASPGVVYEYLDGRGGFRVRENTREAWFEGICDTVDNLALRKHQSRELMAWGMDNLTMKANVKTYVETFQRVTAERSARAGLRLPDVVYVEVGDGAAA